MSNYLHMKQKKKLIIFLTKYNKDLPNIGKFNMKIGILIPSDMISCIEDDIALYLCENAQNNLQSVKDHDNTWVVE